ncbi:hypothetical protein HYS00_04710 [Candidatus Microgenomates bacterium]|nr:hypothetical protein [Candidatus Microgenomates bacterium]
MIDFKKIKTVLVAGSIAYDEIMDFPDNFSNHLHPEKLHALSVSFVVNKLEKQLGGTATSIAYNFALLNRVSVAVLGAVGRDGDAFIAFYKKHKIVTKYIVKDKKLYTSTGKVITDMQNNQIWGFYYGASENIPVIDFTVLDRQKTMLVLAATHSNPFLHLQRAAIKSKLPYLYDPGMVLTWIDDKNLQQGVMNASVLVVNDYEMGLITKRLATSVEELVKKGIICITTLGSAGVLYQDREQRVQVTGFNSAKELDPTGAGDTFRAGLVSGLIDGKELVEALKQGNALASFTIESYGTTNHKPSRKQIAERMKTLKVM